MEEHAAARAARAQLGRAMREARWRRRLAEPAAATVTRIGTTAPVPRKWPVQAISNLVAGIAMVALLFAVLIPKPTPDVDVAPAAAPELVQAPVFIEARLGGRGRTTAAAQLVAVEPTPVPAPEPTAEPTPAPTVAPAQTATPARTPTPGGQPSGAPGGVPGGTPGGVPGGQPGGTGSATPIPTPNRAPLFSTPAPTGFDRITFRVLNGVNQEPLQDVCIVLGTGSCTPSKPHTNALGLWWMDVPQAAGTTLWDVRFYLDRYSNSYIRLTHRPGSDRTVEIRLFRLR